MLFVSRFVTSPDFDQELVGVVDPDDGVEEVVEFDEIFYAYSDLGIDVAGVMISEATNAMDIQTVRCVVPWQPLSTKNTAQTKFKLLANVDIIMYNGAITAIYLTSAVKKGQRIKLSDFASRCEDCIIMGESGSVIQDITLVLDDKIDFSSHTFRVSDTGPGFDFAPGSIEFDIRGLTDKRRVDIIYDMLKEGAVCPVFPIGCTVVDSLTRYVSETAKRGMRVN